MSEVGQYIVADPLGIDQNFKLLKEEGFSLVQEISDTEWTNLNPSDPGVTILEQLCYALTELGYCANFPIKDLLTNKEDKIAIENQFYLPQHILTTSPITANDYRRFLIDKVPQVINAQIIPNVFYGSQLSNVYVVYVNVGQQFRNRDMPLTICKQASFALNTQRNLGELFVVKPLSPKVVKLNGTLYLNSDKGIDQLLASLQYACDNYIFNDVIQYGYDYLAKQERTNQIFNGPELTQGWITDQELGTKKEEVTLNEIESVLLQAEQINSIESLKFYTAETKKDDKKITSKVHQIIMIDVLSSVVTGNLTLNFDGKNIDPKEFDFGLDTLVKYYDLNKNTDQVNAVSLAPQVPSGTYRDVGSYYSVQNTFPSIYAAGNNSVETNAPNKRIAQSRQLRGYLTLFDQVLANEFSQLANIDKLFSFTNATTGTPSDTDRFYDLKNTYQKEHLEYPVPFETFSPTYFYQSLYQVPNIRPLLKNNDVFNFSSDITSKKELENKSWENYKEDPYNSYIWGLKLLTQQDAANLERRNTMLDHLLARVGVSPLRFNLIIEGTIYTNNRLQDKVICKSIYLQNYQQLSYNRTKGYNYLSAAPLNLKKSPVDKKKDQNDVDVSLIRDFIFDSKQIDSLEKIEPSDLYNYSTFELIQWMLLGLRVLYRNFLGEAKNNLSILEKRQLRWLSQHRKGCLFIENKLLFKSANYTVVFKKQADKESEAIYYTNLSAQTLTYSQAVLVTQWANSKEASQLKKATNKGTIKYPGGSLKLIETAPVFNKSDYLNLPAKLWSIAIEANWDNGVKAFINDTKLTATASLIFPDYVTTMDKSFKRNVCTLIDQETAVYEHINDFYASQDSLEKIIRIYKIWHDSLLYIDAKNETKQQREERLRTESENAGKLVNQIKNLKLNNCE